MVKALKDAKMLRQYTHHLDIYNYYTDQIIKYRNIYTATHNFAYLRNGVTELMNMYTVGRMLRTYTKERHGYSKDRAKNIIFHGGFDHAINIGYVLEKFGAKNIKFVGSSVFSKVERMYARYCKYSYDKCETFYDKFANTSCIKLDVAKVFKESLQN